ncbi:uncharacterized protein BX663DRAFT_564467 [Cokeromyces recurvatus]|uniref:uncharacterized protein n=1 Tax=Cokeromyces recurvatus TaxID=90255 RepID=UPI00221EBA4A|nr:uncharacterized protein BX663DRAFT_564467 [Cokeromyces recurvatus]KAI7898829.1 hypothetical protein BX663DRAFT_564467 [Cokeromyces recurvatus]
MMATLERKKKKLNASRNSAEQQQQQDNIVHDDDLTNDPILESLSKEPMEYSRVIINSQCLSSEVINSLQSVKHVCLNVLDLLLLQIIKDLNYYERRSSCYEQSDLLDSITQNTNLIQEQFTSSPMIRSQSSPTTTLSKVHEILDSHNTQMSQHDYTLCCSLAALLNDIYHLLELNSIQQDSLSRLSADSTLLQQELHNKVSFFQREKAAGNITLDETDANQEIITTWDTMNHLMNVVKELVAQQQPPAYEAKPVINDSTNYPLYASPPAYESIMATKVEKVEKTEKRILSNHKEDLDELLNAIDKLAQIAPQFHNQRISFSEEQMKDLAAASLDKVIERLSRGRMEDQRVRLSPPKKNDKILLQELVQQIEKSALRSLDNQRVLQCQQQKKLDFTFIRRIIFDRMNKKTYYTDHDWLSHEEVLIKDLTHTTDLLVKSLDSHRTTFYNRQRYSMSAMKERDLFMLRLFNKVESLEGYRLVNQDANLKSKEEDLQHILNFIYKSKPRLDNQRASFSL